MSLPHRIYCITSNIWVKTPTAIQLLREHRAIEVYDGPKFLGIRLMVLPPPDTTRLAPAELPGIVFDDPCPARKYARLKWEYAA